MAFLAVPWGCLQFVIVVFPDHTHLLFFQEAYHLVVLFYNCSKKFHSIQNKPGVYKVYLPIILERGSGSI